MVPLSESSLPASRPKAKRTPRARKSSLDTDASDAPTKRTTRTRRSDMDTDASDAPAKVSTRARRFDSDADVSDAPEATDATGQPKKPPSSYFLWRTEHYAAVKQSCGANATLSEVNKALVEKWKNLPEEERKPYEEKHNNKKEEWHKDMENYIARGGVPKTKKRQSHRRSAAPKSHPHSAAPLALETSLPEVSQDQSRQWQEGKWRELELRVSSRLDAFCDMLATQMREVRVALIEDIRSQANAMQSAFHTSPSFASASQSVAAELKKPISRQDLRPTTNVEATRGDDDGDDSSSDIVDNLLASGPGNVGEAPEISVDGSNRSLVGDSAQSGLVVVPDSSLSEIIEPQISESSRMAQPSTELHPSTAVVECESLREGEYICPAVGNKPFVQTDVEARSDALRVPSVSQVEVPSCPASSSTAPPPAELTSEGRPVFSYTQHLESSSISPEEARWEWQRKVAGQNFTCTENSIKASVDAKSIASVTTCAPTVITKTGGLQEITGSSEATSQERPITASSTQNLKAATSDCSQPSPLRRANREIASRQHVESKEDDVHSPHSDFDDLIQELSHPGGQALYATTADEDDDDDNESSDVVDDILADLRKQTKEDTHVVTPAPRAECQTPQPSVSIANDSPPLDNRLALSSSPSKTLRKGEGTKSSENVSPAKNAKEDVVPSFVQELEKRSLSFEEARWQWHSKAIEESIPAPKSGSADNKRRKKDEWWNHMYGKRDDAAAQEQKTMRGQQRSQRSAGSFSKGASAREGVRAQSSIVEEFSLLPCARPRTSRLPVSPNGLCKDLPLVDDVLPPMPDEVTRGRSRSRSYEETLGTRRRQFF